jgi:hypothetical protein
MQLPCARFVRIMSDYTAQALRASAFVFLSTFLIRQEKEWHYQGPQGPGFRCPVPPSLPSSPILPSPPRSFLVRTSFANKQNSTARNSNSN